MKKLLFTICATIALCVSSCIEDGFTTSSNDLLEFARDAVAHMRDVYTARVAGGNPEIWKSIISTNKDEIVCALSDYAEKLGQFIEALKASDFEKTTAVLEAGRLFRNSLDSQER